MSMRPASLPAVSLARRALFAALALALPAAAMAQDFSSKPIHLVVGFPPGGSLDLTARIIAQPLSEILKTPVVVDNRPGANGIIGFDFVTRAAPDGRTLLVGSISPMVLAPQATPDSRFNTLTDLVAINTVNQSPQVIAVNPALGIKTLKDLIDRAQTQEFKFSSTGIGSMPHLTIAMLAEAAHAKLLHIPYKGAGPAVNDTVAGHVDGVIMDAAAVYPFVKAGQLIALATTSAKPVDFLPGVPTAAEALPGFVVANWVGVFAPAKTPGPVIDRINAALGEVLAREDVRKLMVNMALAPSIFPSTAEFQTYLAAEYARWGKVLKDQNIVLK